jgi:hypothetical protein
MMESVPTLADLVTAALRERQPELEQLVAAQVDSELERLVAERVDAELERRRNGDAADPPSSPPTSKTCRRCGESKPIAAFPDPTRSTCRSCKARRGRERRAAARARPRADEEPAPVAERNPLALRGRRPARPGRAP